MIRVKRSLTSKFRHKKIIKLSKGYIGRRNNVYRISKQAVIKSLQYSYKHRKEKKRIYRSFFILNINNILKMYGINYNNFIFKLNKLKIYIDRNILYDIFLNDKFSFFNFLFFIRLI